MEVRVATIGRLEPERAGTERLGLDRSRQRPDQAIFGRVAEAGAGRNAHRVDGLDLAPDRRLGGGDDVALLLQEDVRDLLRQRRGLVVDPGELVAGLPDLSG